jgi:NAD(P)-dependent dehydrogenase (short-subunit alcohol dehydrogenase family)
MSLVGCTVLITGGGSGIGRATAVAFAEGNANVVLVDRCEEALLHTKNLVVAKGAQCATFCGDVKDSSTAVESLSKAVEAFGELTFAVNCAGIEGGLAGEYHMHAMGNGGIVDLLSLFQGRGPPFMRCQRRI